MNRMSVLKSGVLALALTAPMAGHSAVVAVDLSEYVHSATYSLPTVTASEASAVTYNWNTDTLFVLGDEGEYVVEVSKTGQQLSVMSLSGFDDTEGLTYIGDNRFVLVEERMRDAILFEYAAGGGASRSSLQAADLGTTIGNIGLEGISFDPRDGSFVTVKEAAPQQVNHNVIDFDAGTATITSLFNPAPFGLLDLSDVQVLAAAPSLQGGVDEDNLLIYSQESARLLEVDRFGNILSQFDFSDISFSAEGLTIDGDGVIYLVAEEGSNPMLYVLTPPAPVPVPPAALLFGSALLGMTALRRVRGKRD